MLARLVSNSWPQVICPSRLPKGLGLQAWATVHGLRWNFLKLSLWAHIDVCVYVPIISLRNVYFFVFYPFLYSLILYLFSIMYISCSYGLGVKWLCPMIMTQYLLLISGLILQSPVFFFWDRILLCHPGWSAVAQSRLTATSASWFQTIFPPQPPE